MCNPDHNDIVLQADNLTKEFRQKKLPSVRALTNISLTAKAGEVTGLVGADGAGKTTLLRLAAGLVLPYTPSAAATAGPLDASRALDRCTIVEPGPGG